MVAKLIATQIEILKLSLELDHFRDSLDIDLLGSEIKFHLVVVPGGSEATVSLDLSVLLQFCLHECLCLL